MSKSGSGGSKPSWKDSNRGSSPSRKSGPAWKKDRESGPTSARPKSKGIRVFQFGVLLVGCFAAIVWLLLQLFQPSPAHVALVGDDYVESLTIPTNVQGLNALRSLQSLAGRETGLTFWGSRRLTVRKEICDLGDDRGWRDGWKTEMQDLRKSFREKTLVIYLALHGAVDPELGPYFLAGAAPSEANRLPFRDVLAAVKELPKDKEIVLVVDAAQIETDWTLGIFGNDFPRALEAMRSEIAAIPNLWVIASCSSDEVSRRTRDFRYSIFGKAFQNALEGRGAGESGRVNLANLFEYVKTEVGRVAAESWGAKQTPVLLGSRGLDEAARVQINVVVKSSDRPDASVPPAESELVGRFAKHLARYVDLSKSVPNPSVTAPAQWRAYREAMIRYESLVRADHRDVPERLEAAILELEKRITAASEVDLAESEGYTLGIRGLTGRPIRVGGAGWPAESVKVWNAAGTSNLSKTWEAVEKSRANVDRRALQAELYSDAFDRLAKSTDDLAGSIEKIRSLTSEIRPRPIPAEIEFAAILAKMVPTSALESADYAGQFARALGLRARAERIAPVARDPERRFGYGERVLPWIRTTLGEADAARRQGEDLLFSSESKDWFRAAEAFTQAHTRYDDADGRAEAVRTALEIRDRAYADLPALSKWAIDRLSELGPSDPARRELAEGCERLWRRLHELGDRLDAAPSPTPALEALAKDVAAGLTALERAYSADLGDLTGTGGVGLPKDWDLAQALAVPISLAPERERLSSPTRGGSGAGVLDLAARNAELRLQARTALALTAPWFDRIEPPAAGEPAASAGSESNWEKSSAVLEKIEEHLGAGSKSEPAARGAALAWIGDQIGRRFLAMPARIDALADGINRLDTDAGRADVALAERMERLVPPGLGPTRSPTSENRKRAIHDYLVAQAIRTWTDHWYAESPTDRPSYLAAGLAFLGDAAKLVKNSPEVAAAKKRIEKSGALVFDEPPLVSLTSEASLPLRYVVKPDEGAEVPPGFPVAWIEPGKNLQVVPVSTDPQFRRVIEFGDEPKPVSLTIGSPLIPKLFGPGSRTPVVEPSSVTVRGFYRGQMLERRTPVGIYPVADVTEISEAPPRLGTIAVRADEGVLQQYGEGTGAIAIVLDCSGSMWEKGVELADSRYRKATKALREVLNSIPAGTKVSIWVFGEKQLDGRAFMNSRESIQQLMPMTTWDPSMTPAVTARAESLEPQYYTPLVRTMIKARDDLYTSGRSLRTLLVLSDGADQPERDLTFEQDAEINPQALPIEQYLPLAFNQTRIRINMVFFQTIETELERVRGNFGVIKRFDPPGFIAEAKDLGALIDSLKRGIEQKLTYRVLREDGRPVKERADARTLVSATPDGDQWHVPALDPGVYIVEVESDRTIRGTFSLDSGDRLLLRLGAGPQGGLALRRGLWREDLDGRASSPPDQGNGRRMTLAQSRHQREGGLSLLLALERTTDVSKTPISQPEPFDFWLDVRGPREARPAGLVWRTIDGYPAPTWAVDTQTWPLDAKRVPVKPIIDAWWSSERATAPDAALEKTKDFDTPLEEGPRGLTGRSLAVDGRNVEIESITVEESRLVIRIRHAVDHPVRIRPIGISPARSEHRWYRAAGKYTALFSATNRDEIQSLLTRLEFTSIDRLTRDAGKRNDHAAIVPNDPPAPNESRPAPIPLDR
ncbi:MAG: hypothetical protein SFX72_21940 [Isosphaeraceae bacterium]|nr:hypothetical protein [Isosphaeraceae bacterium]